MRHAGLDEEQAGIKIARRNINNLDMQMTPNLWQKGKEESEKVGLKLNIQKTKIMASAPITLWQIDGETVADFIFGGLPNHCRW